MRIYIIGSMTFARQMVEVKHELLGRGHEVILPCDTDIMLKDPGFIDNHKANGKHVEENDVTMKCLRDAAEADAVLALNYEKNGVKGYIGTHTIMEIAVAYYMKKKIFVMFDFPSVYEQRWAGEVWSMKPVVLGGDLSKVS